MNTTAIKAPGALARFFDVRVPTDVPLMATPPSVMATLSVPGSVGV